MISYLWAEDLNGLIGNENELPWHLPAELKYFKETTMGHPIIMGRKTFVSIGRPLPGRTNIILTRDMRYEPEGCLVFHTVDEILNWVRKSGEEVFVIGGAEIFRAFKYAVERLYVTKIFHKFEGDCYFPELDWSKWKQVSAKLGIQDEKNPYKYEYHIYERQ